MRSQRLNSGKFISVIAMAGSLLAASCSGDAPGSPTAPTGVTNGPSATPQSAAPVGPSSVADESRGLPMTAVVGTGEGIFNLTHTASNRGGFTGDSQFAISVHGVPPNSVLYLTRSGDIGLPDGQQSDGVCQRASSGLFGPVLTPDGEFVTVETTAGGTGPIHLHLYGNTPDGTVIDTVYRLVDALPPATPTTDLKTPCFTFTVK
jgi:hypothetical protein